MVVEDGESVGRVIGQADGVGQLVIEALQGALGGAGGLIAAPDEMAALSISSPTVQVIDQQ